MYIEPKLKPLYANLKRLRIGDYLYTNEFKLSAIENNFDDLWKECKIEINRKKNTIVLGFHSNEDQEEAFMLFMSTWYDQDYDSFDNLILGILLNFAKWNPTKLDYTGIIFNLKEIGIRKEEILTFTKDFRKIQEQKPIKIEETKIKFDNVPPNITFNSDKIFVVHGKDDKSRLELCNILKDDFKLEPIVLQEKPNNSIETIITKFERLACECSAAIVLFTPDDDAGLNKRARQNVIFELGYFLGKFQEQKNRRIIILKKGNVEIPSDISGVLYLEYNKDVKESFYDLKKQFEHWGYPL
ncbi:MAG: nucleotide-binding protein [Bacteroidota bacterium]